MDSMIGLGREGLRVENTPIGGASGKRSDGGCTTKIFRSFELSRPSAHQNTSA